MLNLNLKNIRKAKLSPWDISNEALYTLCSKYPHHTSQDQIVAKILLIGRAYAAAIERRKKQGNGKDGNFYLDKVAPLIRKSDIDKWLNEARKAKPNTHDGLVTMIKVHKEVTDLFYTISKEQKRSLASKYLHFHIPELFYIFDSRAKKSLKAYSDLTHYDRSLITVGDNEYTEFASKANKLSQFCKEKYKTELNPRHLDNFLLNI